MTAAKINRPVLFPKAFLKNSFAIALPIALQNLMDTAVNTADVLMLSQVSQNAMSASSLAVNVAFILNNLVFGLSSASAVMAAQYYGKGDRTSVERVLGMPIDRALTILTAMAEKEGKLDPKLTKLFVESRCWENKETNDAAN